MKRKAKRIGDEEPTGQKGSGVVMSVRLTTKEVSQIYAWFTKNSDHPFKTCSDMLKVFVRNAIAYDAQREHLSQPEVEQIWNWYNEAKGEPPASDADLILAFLRKGIEDISI